jgi:uncharacterized protein
MTAAFFKISKTAMPVIAFCLICSCSTTTQKRAPKFKVIAFYSSTSDRGHISFLREAAIWFPKAAKQYDFSYESTTNWNNLNTNFLSQYQAVIFLNARPENPAQRAAFQAYMENGGGWLGFHFAGFALTPSAFPQNWDWYHNKFLGSGSFRNNSWRPTSIVLRVEDREHPATRHLPETIKTAPSEWYEWSNDLRTNSDIKVLLSVDPTSYPVGTGPRPGALWHNGDRPIVWTNKRYKMIYLNMGHNDIDDINNTYKDWSATFSSENENKLIIDSLYWMAGKQL